LRVAERCCLRGREEVRWRGCVAVQSLDRVRVSITTFIALAANLHSEWDTVTRSQFKSCASLRCRPHVLPGLRINQKDVSRIEFAKAYTYSRASDLRNLESLSYGLWSSILTSLVVDRRRLLSVPQHILFLVFYKQNPSTVDDGDDGSDQSDPLDTTLSTTVEPLLTHTPSVATGGYGL
jgi:hypothetical protein